MHAILFLFIPDNASITSKDKETLTLLTTNNDSERPSPTESSSVHLVVPSTADSTDEQLKNSDLMNYPVPSSSVENSLVIESTVTGSHPTVLSLGTDGFSSNVAVSYSVENTHTGGGSDLESQNLSAGDSSPYLTLVVTSTSAVILSISRDGDGSSTIIEESSSSSVDDILIIPSATPTPEYSSSPTDDSSILVQVSSNLSSILPMSAGQITLSTGFSITDSLNAMETSSPIQSQTFSEILEVNSSVALNFIQTPDSNVSSFLSDEIFPTQSEDILIATSCSDQECLSSMQSTNTVVSSNEHDLPFNTLNTLHASSTIIPEIRSELSSDLISPASSSLHEEMTSSTSGTIFTSTDFYNESTIIAKSSPPGLHEVTTYDSVIMFESATSERDCCVTVFTDGVSIFPATRTEPPPTSSSTESSFTTLVPPIITSIQETSPMGVSSSISSSTISETTTIESSIENTTPLFQFLNANTTEMPTETVSDLTTTTQTTTTEQMATTVTTIPSTATTPSSTVTTTVTTTTVITTTATTTEPPPETTNASSSLTTESDLPVSTEKMLNTSDAFSEYWVVTGTFHRLFHTINKTLVVVIPTQMHCEHITY